MTDFRLDLYTLYIFPYLDSSLIESSPINQVVLEGNNLTLRCSASGNPTPNITWTKDKSSLVLHQGDTYSIVDIDRNAAGNYTCTAWNGVGEQKKPLLQYLYTVSCVTLTFGESTLQSKKITPCLIATTLLLHHFYRNSLENLC